MMTPAQFTKKLQTLRATGERLDQILAECCAYCAATQLAGDGNRQPWDDLLAACRQSDVSIVKAAMSATNSKAAKAKKAVKEARKAAPTKREAKKAALEVVTADAENIADEAHDKLKARREKTKAAAAARKAAGKAAPTKATNAPKAGAEDRPRKVAQKWALQHVDTEGQVTEMQLSKAEYEAAIQAVKALRDKAGTPKAA